MNTIFSKIKHNGLSCFLAALLLGGVSAGMLTGCAEDEGNYDYTELPTFKVDTVGVQHSFIVQQFNTLQIPSHLTYDGDASKLKYTWSIYKTETGQRDTSVDTLATTKDLNEEIRVSPGSYCIEFVALNPDNGIKAMMQYPVTVESSVGTGLILMYEKSDGSADLAIVKSNLLASGLTSESITTEIFSRANPDYSFKGAPRLFHVTSYYILLATDKDAVRVSGDDMSMTDTFESMFYTVPDVCDITSAFDFGGFDMLINSNKVHTAINSWAATGAYYFSAERYGDYEAAPSVLGAIGGNVFAYDQKHMRFIYGGMWSSTMDDYTNNSGAFDFHDVGKTMISMDYGYGITSNTNYPSYIVYALMKNPADDGSRYIYVVDNSNSSTAKYVAQGIIDISDCPEITSAQNFAYGRRGPVAFYNTENAVYQINYAISDFSCTGATKVLDTTDEISCMKMFVNDGLNLSESANSKYLMIATYNKASDQGTIGFYSVDLASGKLDTTPLQTWKVKGKITGFEFKAS